MISILQGKIKLKILVFSQKQLYKKSNIQKESNT